MYKTVSDPEIRVFLLLVSGSGIDRTIWKKVVEKGGNYYRSLLKVGENRENLRGKFWFTYDLDPYLFLRQDPDP